MLQEIYSLCFMCTVRRPIREEVESPLGTCAGLKAKVTDLIHPEAVFMLHGFGKTVPARTRCYRKGASDALLQENLSDKVGGSPAYDETLVQVKPWK